MEQTIRTLLICLAVPLAVGLLASLLTMGGMGDYAQLPKPPLSRPSSCSSTKTSCG